MALVIPLPTGVPNFELTVLLDGVSYTLGFRWNARAQAWFTSLSTAEGELLLGSRRLVVDWFIWARLRDARRPRGVLCAVDTSGNQVDPGLADLGARVQVLYFVDGEL
jgi:hypothetical protein